MHACYLVLTLQLGLVGRQPVQLPVSTCFIGNGALVQSICLQTSTPWLAIPCTRLVPCTRGRGLQACVLVDRERAASMYAVQPYTTAVAFVEMPYLLAQAIMFMPIVYFLIGARNPPWLIVIPLMA